MDCLRKIQHAITATFLLTSIGACNQPAPSVIGMYFTTDVWQFGLELPTHENLDDFPAFIRKTAQKCESTVLGLDGQITDGGEGIYFLVNGNPELTMQCLESAFPDVRLELFLDAEWKKLTKEYHGHWPIPIDGFRFDPLPQELQQPPQ